VTGEVLKKPHYIALILVILVVVVLFKLPSQTVAKFKLAISGLFLPLFGLAGSTHELANKTSNALTSRRELLRQNAQLLRANQELKFRLQQNDAIWQDNARLQKLIDHKPQSPWKLKLARVIARDPANWWRSLQIDLGSRDGVRANFPVRTTEGLVGRVQAVGETSSQVIIFGDPNLRVAAIVETNRETGVIMSGSSSPQENDIVDLNYLSENTTVRPGQTVTTWGEGHIFPPGIPIGKIVDLQTKDFGLTKEARVKLFADLNSLEEVWVMFSDNSETATPKPEANRSASGISHSAPNVPHPVSKKK